MIKEVRSYQTVSSGVRHMGRQPKYLNFGLIWVMAAAASVTNFIQHMNDRGDLVRAGIFLMMGVFYFWMNDKTKKKK